MKRLGLFLVTAMLLFVAGNGFVKVEVTPLQISDCILGVDDMVLHVMPGTQMLAEPVNINVSIFAGEKVRAVGFTRLETLGLPANGLKLSIPLSASLKKNLGYKVQVVAKSASEKTVEFNAADMFSTGTSSNSFFKRKFDPMPEIYDIRHGIDKFAPRAEMRIN